MPLFSFGNPMLQNPYDFESPNPIVNENGLTFEDWVERSEIVSNYLTLEKMKELWKRNESPEEWKEHFEDGDDDL